MKEITKEILSPLSKHMKMTAYVLLLIIFMFSFYIRAIVPHDAVFQGDIVNFAMDDSVYQMRLVEHAIAIFPQIHNGFYDIYTKFPSGDSVGWGSLFTLMIAFFSVIVSTITNTPLSETISPVAAYVPAVFGALLVFPVFFIGKELSGYKAGIMGAFLIAILPGQLLNRSTLGFADHHIMEVFFTTVMMLFLIMSLKRAEGISFTSYINRDWKVIKSPIIYSVLTGITFGLYLLTWIMGIFFAVIIALTFIIHHIILKFKQKNSDSITVIALITYSITFIMLLPLIKISNGFSANFYSLLHIVMTIGIAIFIVFISYLSHKIKGKNNAYYFTILLAFTITICYFIASFLIPDFFNTTIGNWNYIFTPRTTGGGSTIAEGMGLTNDGAVAQFGYGFILSYVSLALIICLYIFKPKAEYILLIVWTIFIHAIMFAQNRFTYYYAVNVAILSSFFVAYLLNFMGANRINTFTHIITKKTTMIPISMLIIAFIFSTSGIISQSCGDITSLQCTRTQSGSLGEGQYEWYTSLTWLRDNTPEPDADYLGDYTKPYNYSINDYGIMSWWDYGHIITYWGHRIPNANPFQSGIGGGNGSPGASTFLIAQSEKEATNILNKLGVNNQPGARYIISNAYMAYAIQPIFAIWNNSLEGLATEVRTSQGPVLVYTQKYYNTFESKLHIFDGNGLKQYRLIHESTPAPWFRGANEEKMQKSAYNYFYGGNIPIEDTGFVKIFELVKGANISGQIPPNTLITISTTIRTNINRTFEYTQSTTSDINGDYILTVPYSTSGPILIPFDCVNCLFPANKGGTNFDTYPIIPYTIIVNNLTAKIEVSEKEVLEGATKWIR